jgi:hypothetical protein
VACFCFSDNPHVRTTHQMNNLPVILSSWEHLTCCETIKGVAVFWSGKKCLGVWGHLDGCQVEKQSSEIVDWDERVMWKRVIKHVESSQGGEQQARNERNRVIWSGVKWSEVEWSGVKWSEVEWSGVKWSEEMTR